MGVVLIFIIVSIILDATPCSCLNQFLHFTHIHQVLLFLFFCLPPPLLNHWLHTHGCNSCPNIHHRFYYTRSHLLLMSSSVFSFYPYSAISPFLFFCLSSLLLIQCLHTVFILISIVLIFITFFIIVNVSPCLQTCRHYVHPSNTGRLPDKCWTVYGWPLTPVIFPLKTLSLIGWKGC